MELKGKNIGLAMTGSFCTFAKMEQEIRKLKETGAILYPIFSSNVQTTDSRFGDTGDFIRRITGTAGNPPILRVEEAEPIGPKAYLDVLLIAPCTGNTLAKLACGITDTAVTMAAKAHLRNGRPLVIAVSTNDALAGSAKNIGALLDKKNVYFVPFRQDDPVRKPTSVVADFGQVTQTIEAALAGKQLQPLLLGPAG